MVPINKVLTFNLAMAILSIISYEFMMYFFNLIKLNQWDNLFILIGYVPLRGIGYTLIPNVPILIFIITIGVNAYFLHRSRNK